MPQGGAIGQLSIEIIFVIFPFMELFVFEEQFLLRSTFFFVT